MNKHQNTTRSLADNYSEFVISKIRAGYSCHFMTILFPKIPGPKQALMPTMKKQVDRVYSIFATRIHRKPRATNPDNLPIMIGAFDLPVYKKNKTTAPDAIFNAGLHFHALILVPRRSRLRQSLPVHFKEHSDLYTGSGRYLQTIDVRPVVEGYRRVADYIFKNIKRGRIPYDDGVVLLPRTRDELTEAQSGMKVAA